jgi:integrase
MRTKLTTKLLESLQPATGRRYEVRDEVVAGLHIRVSVTGIKVWCLTAKVNDTARRIKIGSYPILSIADARERAREIQRDIQLGKYTTKAEQRAKQTIGDVIPQFINLYAKPRNRSWKSTRQVLKKFESLNAMPVDAVRRVDVVKILDDLIASGLTVGTNRALAAIKKLFAWCVDRGVIDHSPLVGLRAPAKEVSRDRVLSESEIVSCWRASEVEGFPFEQFAKILILTGQRRGEVAGMEWDEVDFDKATWTIPSKRAKNAKQHTVPLAPLAISILDGLPRFLNSKLLFTTTGATPVSGFGRLKWRLEKEVGGTNWRFHDLRRTVATNMAMMGVLPHVIEAVLNHRSGIVSGVAAVYNRHAYLEEKRRALEGWAAKVATFVCENANADGCDKRQILHRREGGVRDCGTIELRRLG